MTARDWRALARSRPSAVALGNFDGVHLGHRRILEALREHAGRHGLEPLVLTFDPHPRHFFSPGGKEASLLTPPREKAALIAELGIEVLPLEFGADLAALTAEAFVSEVLVRRLNGEAFFLGPDHRFGKGALGNAALLHSLIPVNPESPSRGVMEVSPVDAEGEIVSSSAIRRHLENMDLEAAHRMLGRPYALRGEVVRGRERGRLLGFPTANLRLEDGRKILPGFGVYGGFVTLDGKRLPAVGNVGMRPTFGEALPSVEIHILDWNGDLYGREMAFEVRRNLRPERRFESMDSLKGQIAEDVAEWRRTLPPAQDP